MNSGTRAEAKRHPVLSVGNWTWTIILSLIPAVNIIAFIVFIIAGRSPVKRNYAIAALIVSFLFVLLYLTAILFFADPLLNLFAEVKNATPLQ